DGQTINHEINTHPYDIALVDPVAGSSSTFASFVSSYTTQTLAINPTRADIAGISSAIAHEAGHTFGLEHVRSDGVTDAKTPKDASGNYILNKGTVQDIQAYDAPNVF